MTFENLRIRINEGDFPSIHEHFGGANLIITDDPNRFSLEHDIVVLSDHAGALSWLVFEIKFICNDRIDYINKYDFYPAIGLWLNQAIDENLDLFECMLFVLTKVEMFWESYGSRP